MVEEGGCNRMPRPNQYALQDASRCAWAGDGSANKGVMGTGSVRFQRPGRNLLVRVGRVEEGVSSLPELAAIARTLQATALDLLYL